MKKGESWLEISVECPYCHHIMHGLDVSEIDNNGDENLEYNKGVVWCWSCEKNFIAEVPDIL